MSFGKFKWRIQNSVSVWIHPVEVGSDLYPRHFQDLYRVRPVLFDHKRNDQRTRGGDSVLGLGKGQKILNLGDGLSVCRLFLCKTFNIYFGLELHLSSLTTGHKIG